MAVDRLTFRVVADPSSSREIPEARLDDKIPSVLRLRGQGHLRELRRVAEAVDTDSGFEAAGLIRSQRKGISC